MPETKKTPSKPPLAIDQVIDGINNSIAVIDDSRAKQLGLAALRAKRTAVSREKYILFRIGNFFLAILQNGVDEVGDLPSITQLPNIPHWISGITNIRSEIVSVIDLPSFMGWDISGSDSAKKIIVVSKAGVKCAVQINQILGSRYKTEDTETVSGAQELNQKNTEIIKEGLVIDGNIFYILDYEKLFASDRFTKLTD